MKKPVQDLIQAIKNQGKPDKAQWLENYVKHGVQSYGLGIPEIRKTLIGWNKEQGIHLRSYDSQKLVLDQLMKSAYTEPKLAAILFIQLYWKTESTAKVLEICSHWFDQAWISDWNVTDWLCVRLLTPQLDQNPDLALPEFRQWNQDPYLWKARASLVPFAQSKNLAQHKNSIEAFSEKLIKREERFCKTAVGWVLRQYSKIDPDYVRYFLDKHQAWTSKELIKNATKYF